MKLADLKRIPIGTELKLVNCFMGKCDKKRIVAKVSSNAVMFTGEGIAEGRVSYLYFPKASEFKSDEKGFTIFEGEHLAAQYEFVK